MTRDPRHPPQAHWRAALPPRSRRWWAGGPRLALENTGALLLPSMLPLRTSDRVLEVGCGRGTLSAVLAARAQLTTTAIGLDGDRSLLRGGRETVELVQGSPGHLPFEADAFTVVLAGHQIRAWSDDVLRAFLAESWRVLSHNGVLVLWEVAPSRSEVVNRVWRTLLSQPHSNVHLRRFADLSRMGREAHFAWIQTVRIQPILWPPGPRVGVLMRKEYYDRETIDLASGETRPYRSRR